MEIICFRNKLEDLFNKYKQDQQLKKYEEIGLTKNDYDIFMSVFVNGTLLENMKQYIIKTIDDLEIYYNILSNTLVTTDEYEKLLDDYDEYIEKSKRTYNTFEQNLVELFNEVLMQKINWKLLRKNIYTCSIIYKNEVKFISKIRHLFFDVIECIQINI